MIKEGGCKRRGWWGRVPRSGGKFLGVSESDGSWSETSTYTEGTAPLLPLGCQHPPKKSEKKGKTGLLIL